MKKTILLIGCLLVMLGAQAHSITLDQFLNSSNLVKKWDGFKNDQCFHCSDKESIVTIDGKTYEISTFRVVGLENSTKYKDFESLVAALKLGTRKSEVRKLYKDFPGKQFELLNIDIKNPKVKILIALKVLTPKPIGSA